MAKKDTQTVETQDAQDSQETAERTTPMTLGPNEGGNAVAAAWRGAVNLFGAQVERWDFVPGEGVVAVGLTFNSDVPAETLVSDLYRRGDKNVSRRLDFTEFLPYFNGEAPEPYTDSNDMTQWMVQFLKGAGEGDGSRSPQYAKDAIAAYKIAHQIAAPRGRRRRIVRIANLGELNTDSLSEVDTDELTTLQATITRALEIRSGSAAEATA